MPALIRFRLFLSLILAVALVAGSCSGDRGKRKYDGADGPEKIPPSTGFPEEVEVPERPSEQPSARDAGASGPDGAAAPVSSDPELDDSSAGGDPSRVEAGRPARPPDATGARTALSDLPADRKAPAREALSDLPSATGIDDREAPVPAPRLPGSIVGNTGEPGGRVEELPGGDRGPAREAPERPESTAPPGDRSPEPSSENGPSGRIRLTAFPSAPIPGQKVEIAVTAEDVRDVHGVAFHLHYDPEVLRYEGGAKGPFLGSDGQSVTFLAAPTSGNDRIVVGIARLGPVAGMSGSGLVCRFTFAAVGPGDANLVVSNTGVWDSDGARQPVALLPVSVSVR